MTGAATAIGADLPADHPADILRMRDITMKFGGVAVLRDVSLSLRRAEILGLLGANGSGKSTLIKVLAGFNSPEPGGIVRMWGTDMTPPLDPLRIRRLGVSFVHQHLGLVPSLTVAENMLITEDRRRGHWFIRWGADYRALRALFAEFDIDIDPGATVDTLTMVERALLAILRAVRDLRASEAGRAGEGILVLDEPTPFLTAEDVDKLFALLRAVKKTGTSVIIVTHDIDEVLAITDRVAVMRDGVLASVSDTATTTRQAILDTIVGRAATMFERAPRGAAPRGAAVKVEGLTGDRLDPLSLSVAPGEVVGVTGLIGSGFDDIPYLLFGARQGSGQLAVGDDRYDIAALSPARAVASGIALLPGDRIGQGGIGGLSVSENATMLSQGRFRKVYGLDLRAITAEVERLIAAHDVRPPRPDLPLGNLSGGNQQKVILGKWLAEAPRLLLLDEPTQGVDFGARQQIFEALDSAARAGTAILCASTDYEQLAQICDRVIVFSRGAAIAELTGAKLNKDSIARACFSDAAEPMTEAAE
jgi:ribose transport system ATP-binding protein